MEKTEYSFSAVTAGQFATELDFLMEQARNKAVSLDSTQTIMGAVVSANVLLIPIQDVQSLMQEAFRLGANSTKTGEKNAEA